MPIILLLVIIVGVYLVLRANDLFVLSIRNGEILVVRGRVPVGFVSEIEDIVRRPTIVSATIRAERGPSGVRLRFSGSIGEGQQQQIRNVFGLFPQSKIRSAPPIPNPTLGQILGIAWLAWLLRGRNYND